ncbi:nucleotidyltransferase family protein [Cohnella fermenti]|uniref:Nucleotidyltransferase family protein n=1 Tax=Cohnella fermenti TaxID=2565925 RepID=A0A4S4BQN1_9BACL|nr:nucleotidyltransferase family protein [Cohnella fermenti]THF74918.1 hypothetical protein E6C55_23500 [Cohnella fermenti]
MMIPFLQELYKPHPEFRLNEEDCRRLLAEIELFGIAAQVYMLLKEKGDAAKRLPELFWQSLAGGFTNSVQFNLYMKVQEEAILGALERNRIHGMPLKGIQFASRYFGHYGARLTSDIDIYVPEAELRRAIRCLEEQGFAFEIIKDHHARLHRGDLTVELHLTFDKQYWSRLDPAPFWNESERFKEYRYIRQLSTQQAFYFICLHGARHHMDNMRFVLDIVQMLYRSGEEIDFDLLFKQARRDLTSRRIRTVLTIVYRQFPQLQMRKPLDMTYIDSGWNYDTIRAAILGRKGVPYYRYKLHFKHLIFDSWKYALKSISKPY